MVDLVAYRAPLGPLGRLAEIAFLTAYLDRFLVERGQCLKGLAEGEAWQQFLLLSMSCGLIEARASSQAKLVPCVHWVKD